MLIMLYSVMFDCVCVMGIVVNDVSEISERVVCFMLFFWCIGVGL